MRKIAVITETVSADLFFYRFMGYYGGLFGSRNIYVLTFRGMKEKFTLKDILNVIELPGDYSDHLRTEAVSAISKKLLEFYDYVIVVNVDEFLIPDRRYYPNLLDYIEKTDLRYISAFGIDVIEKDSEPAIDPSQPIIGRQRRFGVRSSYSNKTCITSISLLWDDDFHSCSVAPKFDKLYNFHLKFADVWERIQWLGDIRINLGPKSEQHDFLQGGFSALFDVTEFQSLEISADGPTSEEWKNSAAASFEHNFDKDKYTFTLSRDKVFFEIEEFFYDSDWFIFQSIQLSLFKKYEGLAIVDMTKNMDAQKIIETSCQLKRVFPKIIIDLSKKNINLFVPNDLDIHSSCLVQRENVLLFGPNNLIDADGRWSCEVQTYKKQFLDYFKSPSYNHWFPGQKFSIAESTTNYTIKIGSLDFRDVPVISDPVFLATPLEPPVWGRWITTVIPKIQHYFSFGDNRKFLCQVDHPWQRRLLNVLGIKNSQILPHDPGRVYFCKDLLTVEYSIANLTISQSEKNAFQAISNKYQKFNQNKKKLFISRLSRSKSNPNYRVLLNEGELILALEERGFFAVEPELLLFEEQVGLFANAEEIIFLGGSGIFNAVFCNPTVKILDIESSTNYIRGHIDFFSSLCLSYGIVFGHEEGKDSEILHRNWTIDIPYLIDTVKTFFN